MTDTPRRRGISLTTQLFTYAALGIVFPTVLLGGIAFFALSYRLDIVDASFVQTRTALTENAARADLTTQASGVARQVDAFLIERIVEVRGWASAQVVIESARAAHDRHTADGLTEISAEAVERRFQIDKSLNISPEANAFLHRQVTSSPYFAEIFYTDRNGFNVALTNPTSDFIQSDEGWWQRAWSRGISLGEVEYDDSAGVWSIEISVRIDDPENNSPVGVMKSVLAIEAIQKIADWAVERIPGGRVQIATENGLLIAETSSNHARERIMNPSVNLADEGNESLTAAFGAERLGFVIDDEWITTFAHTAGVDAYASVIARFNGFGWIVLIQKPVAEVQGPITALRSIEEALRDWRWILAWALLGVVVLSVGCVLAFAVALGRRYRSSLDRIREFALRAADGGRPPPVPIERPEEIALLNEAVARLGQALQPPQEQPRRSR